MAPRWKVKPSVAVRKIGADSVLMDMEVGTYYGLNEVGARAWDLLRQGSDYDNLVSCLEAEYEVDGTVLRQDVTALLGELVDRGLIISDDPGREAGPEGL